MICKKCGNDKMINIEENKTCIIIWGKGHVITQYYECQICGEIEKKHAIFSIWKNTREFMGWYESTKGDKI